MFSPGEDLFSNFFSGMNTFLTNMLTRIESWLNIPVNDLYRNSELDTKLPFWVFPVNYSCLNVELLFLKFNFKMFECSVYVFELQ